jgi:hypothetical protein
MVFQTMGRGWVVLSGTVTNMDVGDRAYRDVLAARPGKHYPILAAALKK